MGNEDAVLKEIANKISAAQKILILTHVSPDPDALGSSFALCDALQTLQKEAAVVLCEQVAQSLAFIGGDYIVYSPEETYEADLVVCVDCSDLNRLDCAKAIAQAHTDRLINMDHHKDNTHFGSLNYVDAGAAAAGEIIFRLIPRIKAELTQKAARWLYTAISADTGGFRYSNTTPDTMRIAADLMEYGIDFRSVSRELYETVDYNLLKLKAKVMEEVQVSADGRIAYVSITNEMLKRFGVKEEDANSMVDIARSIRGVEIAFSLKEKENGVKISLRSEQEADVSKIARQFGGGGHVKAAGITMTGITLEEAKKLVLAACEKELER